MYSKTMLTYVDICWYMFIWLFIWDDYATCYKMVYVVKMM